MLKKTIGIGIILIWLKVVTGLLIRMWLNRLLKRCWKLQLTRNTMARCLFASRMVTLYNDAPVDTLRTLVRNWPVVLFMWLIVLVTRLLLFRGSNVRLKVRNLLRNGMRLTRQLLKMDLKLKVQRYPICTRVKCMLLMYVMRPRLLEV